MLGQDLAADLGRFAGRRRDRSAVHAHDLAPERLLLIRDLDHIHLAVQPQVGAGHRERRAPLARAGLGRHALQALLLGIVRLRDGAVELVAARGVVALELIVDLCRGAQALLQAVGAHKRRGAVHFVKVADLGRDRDLARVVVQLLADQLVAENRAQVVVAHRRAGGGVQKRRGFCLHVRAHVVPGAGQFVFGQVNFVGDLFGSHGALLSLRPAGQKQTGPCPRALVWKYPLGQKPVEKLLRCHPNWRGESPPAHRGANTPRSR